LKKYDKLNDEMIDVKQELEAIHEQKTELLSKLFTI